MAVKASAPASRLLPDGRLHLQHGPIDLIIEANADAAAQIDAAYQQAVARFQDVLQRLVDELPLLRAPLTQTPPQPHGPVAQRMLAAVWPFRDVFITPMAAVAGAVADEMLAALVGERTLRRAYVNNGGDIALHLAQRETFRVGVAGIEDSALHGMAQIDAASPVRGIATSGWRGRSFSFGIADSVTVTAANAAAADAAATLIGNAVNVDDARIERVPAASLQPESDLGARLVTRAVPPLAPQQIDAALASGVGVAHEFAARGLINGAALRLQGQVRVV